MRNLTFAIALLVATPAQAERLVMFYCDSRCGTGPAPTFPAIVDAARADFLVCNQYANGRNTEMAVRTVDTAIDDCTKLGELTDVVILLGVNSLLAGIASEKAADDIRTVAARVRERGYREWIVLEPPGPRAWGGKPAMDARRYTRDVVTALIRKNGERPAYNLIDARDEFLVARWYAAGPADPTACSNDELHPTGPACKQVLAEAVLAALP